MCGIPRTLQRIVGRKETFGITAEISVGFSMLTQPSVSSTDGGPQSTLKTSRRRHCFMSMFCDQSGYLLSVLNYLKTGNIDYIFMINHVRRNHDQSIHYDFASDMKNIWGPSLLQTKL